MSARKTAGRDPMDSLPLHIGDWLSSATVAVLGAAGESAYLRLLMHQWNSEDDGLPSDSEELRSLTRATPKEWTVFWPKLARQFPEDLDGKRRNARLQAEWRFCTDRREARRAAGRNGGNASVRATGKQPSSKPEASVKQIETPSPSPSLNSSSTAVQQLSDSSAVLQQFNTATAGILPIKTLADRASARLAGGAA